MFREQNWLRSFESDLTRSDRERWNDLQIFSIVSPPLHNYRVLDARLCILRNLPHVLFKSFLFFLFIKYGYSYSSILYVKWKLLYVVIFFVSYYFYFYKLLRKSCIPLIYPNTYRVNNKKIVFFDIIYCLAGVLLYIITSSINSYKKRKFIRIKRLRYMYVIILR